MIQNPDGDDEKSQDQDGDDTVDAVIDTGAGVEVFTVTAVGFALGLLGSEEECDGFASDLSDDSFDHLVEPHVFTALAE